MQTNPAHVFLSTSLMILFISSGCGAGQLFGPTATATATVTATYTPSPAFTPTPTFTATPTPDVAATQQYEDFFSWVQKFHGEGLISSLEGEYHALSDMSVSLAAANSFIFDTSDIFAEFEPENFIIQSDVKIQSASEGSKTGGCGYYFFKGGGRVIFFRQNGNMFYWKGGVDTSKKYVDSALGEGPAGMKLTLLVNGEELYFFINDRQGMSDNRVSISSTSGTSAGKGIVGPSIISGSDEEFGTRCDFTNMVLWIMD